MKCAICNAENPPDATSCQECGFSLSFSQPAWPDFPSVEASPPLALPEWPEIPEAETEPPALPSIPQWPEPAARVPTPAVAEDVDAEIQPFPLPAGDVLLEEPHIDHDTPTEVPATADIPSPDVPSDDDLARTHVARGFAATREGLVEQARWEFEQARDLADSEDIFRLAQAQLGELVPEEAAQVVREPVRPILKPPPRPALSRFSPTDWKPTLRIGVMMGVINAVCTSCTAPLWLGVLLSPFLGFVAGLLIARDKSRPSSQPSEIIHALAAGVLTGLGGWLGQAIGYSTWTTSILNTLDLQSDSATLICTAFLGLFCIPLTITLSALGWRLGQSKGPSV
jgi:hypothetical protein